MKITIESFGAAEVPTLNVEGLQEISKSESKAIERILKDLLEKYTDKSPLSI